MIRASLFAVAAVLLTVAPAAAYTNDRTTRAVEVRYADLDLSTEADAEVLMQRLERASRRVCRTNGRQFAAERADYNRCRAESVEKSVAQIGSPILTARYNDKMGRTVQIASSAR
jgi:UrcA family protein